MARSGCREWRSHGRRGCSALTATVHDAATKVRPLASSGGTAEAAALTGR